MATNGRVEERFFNIFLISSFLLISELQLSKNKYRFFVVVVGQNMHSSRLMDLQSPAIICEAEDDDTHINKVK